MKKFYPEPSEDDWSRVPDYQALDNYKYRRPKPWSEKFIYVLIAVGLIGMIIEAIAQL